MKNPSTYDVEVRAPSRFSLKELALCSTVAELLSHHEGSLFATTSDERMKKTLTKAGFVQSGLAWEGRKGQQLSLWLRLDPQGSRSPRSNACKQQGAHK